jgi:hypothetical protein
MGLYCFLRIGRLLSFIVGSVAQKYRVCRPVISTRTVNHKFNTGLDVMHSWYQKSSGVSECTGILCCIVLCCVVRYNVVLCFVM